MSKPRNIAPDRVLTAAATSWCLAVETTTQRVLGRANERLVLRVQRTPDSSHLILSSRFRGKPFAPDAMIAISARDAQGREKNVTRRLRSTVNAVREVQLRRFSTRWRSVPPSMAGCSSAGAFFERDQSGERCLRVNRKRRRSDGRKRPVRPSGNPLAEAGVGAVVLPSLFEEQIRADADRDERLAEAGTDSFGEAMTYLIDPDASI